MTLLSFSLWVGLVEIRGWFDSLTCRAGLAIALMGYIIFHYTVRW
jgi:hypothetical protein